MNELRLLGGGAMCLASCAAGLRAAYLSRRQLAQTERLRHALTVMRCEIDYGKTPLPELCERLSQSCEGAVGAFYGALGRCLPRTGERLSAAVDAALRATPSLELPPGPLRLLRELLCGFGQYGSAEQLSLLDETLRLLDAELRSLRERQASVFRCRAVLGVSAGLSLFLLVI